MTPYRRFKADSKAQDSMLAIGGAILVVCLLIVAAIAIAQNWEVSTDTVNEAQTGSTVKVNYIGTYSNGWVFDTNIYAVAVDSNVTKSFEFTSRSASSYTPTQFKIGSSTLLTGFQNAVIGMRVNETVTVTLSPAEAYGLVPAENLRNITINQTVSVIETVSQSEFQTFYGQTASVGLTITHPEYGWDVTVLHIVADTVTVQNLPAVGEQYSSYGEPSDSSPTGWYINVTSKNADEITFVNLLTSSMVNKVKGVDAAGEVFYLHAVDATSFTLKYDRELVGNTLTFTITLVEIL